MRSMPSCLMMSRCTSATVTFSITWSRPRMVRLLTTLSAVADEAGGDIDGLLRFGGVRDAAGEHHAVADAVDAHIRVRQQLLQHGARTPLRSRVTATSKPAICLPSASKK